MYLALPWHTSGEKKVAKIEKLIDASMFATRRCSIDRSTSRTIGMTLLFGVEVGVLVGVATSIGLHLHRTMRPHFAIVGAVPGTEHYRNVQRHDVVTHHNILSHPGR